MRLSAPHRPAALVVSLLTAVALWLGAGPALAYTAAVNVTATPVSAARPGDFLGLALTYGELPKWMPASGPIDQVLVRLIRNLTPVGRPSLRIGGESADRSWWPIPGVKRPPGISNDLGPNVAAAIHRTATATNAQLLLGLELEADIPRLDAVESEQLLARIGSRYIQAFEIGNEPDLYTVIPWYKVLNGQPIPWYSKVGTPVYARAQPYTPAQFATDVAAVLGAIPKYPIAGPETGIESWLQAFSRFLAPAGPVTVVTSHAYGVDQCIKQKSLSRYPTVPNLVSLIASRTDVHINPADITLAHMHGARYRIDELGAVTCGGPKDVSETMATALWAVDALFDADSQGIDGVNLHSNSKLNQLFSIAYRHGHWVATVEPIYLGAMLFAQADPAGSRLLGVDGGSSPSLRVWATESSDDDVRITVINDSLSQAAQVRLHVPATVGHAAATVERLEAAGDRGAYATSGITLGGQAFQTTTTGQLPRPRLQTTAVRGGTLTVDVPKGSVALVTLDAQPASAGGRAAQPASARGRSAATSSHGRVLTTASGPSHARRAVAIP